MRRLRFIPNDGALVEVTTRTLHSRYLLRSSRELDEIIVGVLGRAQRLYEVRVCGYLFLSSHYHLLLDVDNARQLTLFMAYVNSNLAREISRLHRWPEKIWSRRYQAIVISDEEAARIARLRYLLANGCKEGLVARPQDWPGVHVAKALIQGEDLIGTWFDRTQEYAARNRGEKFDRLQYASPETLYLSPLPCWKHLAKEAWRTRALSLIQEIAAETKAQLSRTGSQPLGAAAILSQHPHHRPEKQKRSPAPLFHAFSAAARRELWEAYRLFVGAYRQAADKLRAGNRAAVFPLGSFPPALPFVGG
jgi:putative transposase